MSQISIGTIVSSSTIEKPTLTMPLIYDDRGIFAVDKPAGTDVFQGTFVHTGYPRLWTVIQEYKPYGSHVHRIDRHTSGVLMCGETKRARSYLKSIWPTNKLRKFYLAIVANVSWEHIFVEAPIDGVIAGTDFRVLDRAGGYSLISAELVKFGRTHQIRRHLRLLGSSIVGDKRYRGPQSPITAVRGGDGQLLHAWRVEFVNPVTGSKCMKGHPLKIATLRCEFDHEQGLTPGNVGIQIQARAPWDFRTFYPDFDWDTVDKDASPQLAVWRVGSLDKWPDEKEYGERLIERIGSPR